MSGFDTKITQFGFKWGPAHVQRLCSDKKWGVMMTIRTPKQFLDIRITPSGMIRVEQVSGPASELDDPELEMDQ